ncbi:MAG: folate-binding protein [Actinomycetia bacterium]|nr:folate-binding protein [Actinomycetes bacterium]
MRVDATTGPDQGLPWHYGDPIAEQRLLESGSGAVDLSNRDLLSISGPDRLGWLHSLTSQVFEGLAPGSPVSAYVLSPQGHIEHALYGVDDGETLWAWTEPGRGPALLAWLDQMRFRTRVEVRALDDLALVWRPGTPPPDGRHRAGQDSLGGYESFVPADQVAALVAPAPAGTWAYEARRIAFGVPRLDVDIDERTIPNELGVPSAAVALGKGCYRGQETVARVHNLGRPPRRLVRLHLDGSMSELPEPGAPLHQVGDEQGRPVGRVGLAAYHYELGPVALALVKRQLPVTAELVTGQVAAAQEVLVDPEIGVHFRPSQAMTPKV